ncbi:hypothetical protein Tco_0599640 [Tanacetum coccineum]
MVAYLEKTDGNTDFHEIIDFLTRSSIHYALTVSPVVSTTLAGKIINNVMYITAKVAGKPITISEASIGRNVTPLFESMLVPTILRGGPDPSPRLSSTIHIPDSIPEDFGGNHGGQSSSDKSLSGNEDGLTL